MRLILFFTALLACFCAAAQSQSVLIAQTGTYDSLTYKHSNGRNSIIKPRYLSAIGDPSIYNHDTADVYNMVCKCVDYRNYRVFNAAGLITESGSVDTNGVWETRTTNTYNSQGLLEKSVTEYAGSSYKPEDLYAYQNGVLVERIRGLDRDSFIASGPGSDSVHRFYKSTWNGWEEQYYNKYKRDASNRILTDSAFSLGQFASLTYFLYDAQGRRITDSVRAWESQTSQMYFEGKDTYHFDAQSNLVSLKRWNWNRVTNSYKSVQHDTCIYNVHNQITSIRHYDSTSNGWTPGSYRNFYYQVVVDVPEISKSTTLQLYPIPATSYINLSMQFTKPQAFGVRIFDMQGRLVSNWQEPAQKDYNKQIPLTGMAPGQYTLHIWAGDESVSRQFTVVR